MALQSPTVLAHLRNDFCSVVLAEHQSSPFLAYIGTPLGESEIDTYLLQRGVLGGGLDGEVFPSLISEPRTGWMGLPGIQLRNSTGAPVLTHLTINNVNTSDSDLTIVLHDDKLAITVTVTLDVSPAGPLTATATIVNRSDRNISLDALRIAIPVGPDCEELLTLGGRHAMEAVEHRHIWKRSRIVVDNRSGRTSHEQMGVVFAGEKNFSEQKGALWAVHCGWSGNYEISCDALTESLRVIHVGECLTPGEITLAPGNSYTTPHVVVAFSNQGMNHASQQFHQYLRRTYSPDTFRPVILNTWEAVYFNHDLDTLKDLATQAAAVGVERFVLDDGWFHRRRNDTAGLGDWWVDASVWPDGLGPLIEHVHSLGMEFGLWCEPEMVNPDSDLFRAHPEWALHGTEASPVLGRHQLVLDMSRTDVRDYLCEHLSTLLTTYDIAYMKWDHNRPLVGALAHHQTLGVYELFERLTAAFPHVQFESCASGGGRIDMGISRYVQRFWSSDSIDALDRLTIQKGISKVIPLEMMGSHIGSPTCHTTGRKHALSFRTATAMFGWLGIEWNLLSMSDKEKQNLADAVRLYKTFRPLLHSGRYQRWDNIDPTMHIHGVVAHDSSEALISVTRLSNGASHRTLPLKISDLDEHSTYHLQLVTLGTPRWALHRELPDWITHGLSTTGAHLRHLGVPLAPLLPESTALIHLTRTSS